MSEHMLSIWQSQAPGKVYGSGHTDQTIEPDGKGWLSKRLPWSCPEDLVRALIPASFALFYIVMITACPSTQLVSAYVKLEVMASDAESAILSAADLLANHPQMLDFAAYQRALLERESLQSTALPNGVALPHARGEMLAGTVFAAIRLHDRVKFGKTSVRLVFVIGTPLKHTSEHLALLAWLARQLSDPHLVESLLATTSAAEFCALLAENGPGQPS